MSEHALPSKTEQHPHIVKPIKYATTFVQLAILMAVTVAAAQVTLPGGTVVNNIVAMSIACYKAYLVVSIFMGVRYSSSIVKLWAMLGFVWFFLMFIIFADYATRKYEPAPSWDARDTGSAMPREMMPPMGKTSKEIDPNVVNIMPR